MNSIPEQNIDELILEYYKDNDKFNKYLKRNMIVLKNLLHLKNMQNDAIYSDLEFFETAKKILNLNKFQIFEKQKQIKDELVKKSQKKLLPIYLNEYAYNDNKEPLNYFRLCCYAYINNPDSVIVYKNFTTLEKLKFYVNKCDITIVEYFTLPSNYSSKQIQDLVDEGRIVVSRLDMYTVGNLTCFFNEDFDETKKQDLYFKNQYFFNVFRKNLGLYEFYAKILNHIEKVSCALEKLHNNTTNNVDFKNSLNFANKILEKYSNIEFNKTTTSSYYC